MTYKENLYCNTCETETEHLTATRDTRKGTTEIMSICGTCGNAQLKEVANEQSVS